MEVHINNKNHLDEFIRLNEEWINKYFSIEEVDKSLARNPVSIIDNNGFIFSLVENGVVVGVCALFNEGEGVYELARMAVSPLYQGKGYGRVLMQSCLNKLKEINATRVYLLSNTKLEAAIAMYKKFGFVVIKAGRHPVYSRANIVMERST
jgi:putative acetyltransferase